MLTTMTSQSNDMLKEMLTNQSFHAVNPHLFDEIEEIRSPITSSSKYENPLPILSHAIWEAAIVHLESMIQPIERILPMYNMGYRYLIAVDKEDSMNIDYIIERDETPQRWKPIAISYLDNEMPPLSWDVDYRERNIKQVSPVEVDETKKDASEMNECCSCLEQTSYVCDECNEPTCKECVTKDGLCSLCNRYYTKYSSEYYSE